MKHWQPHANDAVPLRRPRRRDWASLHAYAPPKPRPRGAKEVHVGGWTGLVMVAVACAVMVIFAATLLAPVKPVDRSVRIEATR